MSGWRAKAEACFALARSSTFEGERQNAIARGLALIENNGGSADDFDIPGRSRSAEEKQRWAQYERQLRANFELNGESEANELRCQMEQAQRAEASFRAKMRESCVHGVPGAYRCPDCEVTHA